MFEIHDNRGLLFRTNRVDQASRLGTVAGRRLFRCLYGERILIGSGS